MKLVYCLVTITMLFSITACSQKKSIDSSKKTNSSSDTYAEHQKEMAEAASKLK